MNRSTYITAITAWMLSMMNPINCKSSAFKTTFTKTAGPRNLLTEFLQCLLLFEQSVTSLKVTSIHILLNTVHIATGSFHTQKQIHVSEKYLTLSQLFRRWSKQTARGDNSVASRHDYIDGAFQLVWVELREFGKVRVFRVGLGPSTRSTSTLHIVDTRHLPKAYQHV